VTLNLALRLGAITPAASASAPTFIASTSAQTTSATVTVTTPSGATGSDWLIVWASVDGSAETIATPSGWTQVVANTSTAPYSYVFARQHDGSSGSYNFTKSAAVITCITLAAAYSGCSGVDASGITTGFSATPSAPSITTTVADTRLLAMIGTTTGDNGATAPTGYTSRANLLAGSSSARLSDKDTAQPTGATGAAAPAANYSGSRSWAAAHVALKP
jgi:hypothetical protein